MYNQPLPTREELAAVIDEAHRRGMWVASHTYGGEGLKMAIDLGLDNIQHATAANDDDIRRDRAEAPAHHHYDSRPPPG